MTYALLEFCEEIYCNLSNKEMTKHLKKIFELEIGKIYEIIISNSNGLYRYRIKDSIRVIKFMENKLPIFEFFSRKEYVSLNDTKVSAKSFKLALNDAIETVFTKNFRPCIINDYCISPTGLFFKFNFFFFLNLIFFFF
jgi:hypothetical protein